MTKVSATTELAVPAQTVWDVIGGFNSVSDWHPAIAKCETTEDAGAKVRTMTLAGGAGKIVERLESASPGERSYTYSILSGPLPVANYVASIRVKDKGDGRGCTIEWSSEFEAAGATESDAATAIRGIYEAGFENLKRMFGAV